MQTAIEVLATNLQPAGTKMLVGGEGEWRVHIGDYRIIYEINDGFLTILVLTLGHRREIYRRR